MADESKIKEIQEYLDGLKNPRDTIDIMGLRNLEKLSKVEYHDLIDETTYLDFIQSGDYHYFVSRTLFHFSIDHYSFFAAQQCVENYLKAYLRFQNQIPPNWHLLPELLVECRKVSAASDAFINSDHCETMVRKYNPYNELARYPIQKIRPQDGSFGVLRPLDIWILDYFVFCMRQIMPVPTDDWNIMEPDGHQYLQCCGYDHPDILKRFMDGNINFGR